VLTGALIIMYFSILASFK